MTEKQKKLAASRLPPKSITFGRNYPMKDSKDEEQKCVKHGDIHLQVRKGDDSQLSSQINLGQIMALKKMKILNSPSEHAADYDNNYKKEPYVMSSSVTTTSQNKTITSFSITDSIRQLKENKEARQRLLSSTENRLFKKESPFLGKQIIESDRESASFNINHDVPSISNYPEGSRSRQRRTQIDAYKHEKEDENDYSEQMYTQFIQAPRPSRWSSTRLFKRNQPFE